MGLDMYLNKELFLTSDNGGSIEVKACGNGLQERIFTVDLSKVTTITERVAYWRKANQIHNWFVNNVQNGVDDCKTYTVRFEKLMELKELCFKALQTKDSSLIPPKEGFFFGSTEVDDYYWLDIYDTYEALKDLDSNGMYSYQSSW